jgi:predicted transposase YdaD
MPLKLLVSEFAREFVAWLLNVADAEVRYVQPLNVELPSGAVRADQVFQVTLAGGQDTLLHIEFQGRGSERPMSLRMLDYIGRLAQREQGNLCSVVFYVGDGAGADDEGAYQVQCPGGDVTLSWRYRVIRLWQMRAEELLALDRPALLTLIGQTRIEEQKRVLPQAVETIQRTPDEGERARLLAALIGLMRDEEVLKMAEQLMEAADKELMLDTPFLRRIREEGRDEGRDEGRAEGRAEGQAEGLVKGLVESILEVMTTRLELSVPTYRRLERQISTITDVDRLRELLQAAAQVADVAEFEQVLKE